MFLIKQRVQKLQSVVQRLCTLKQLLHAVDLLLTAHGEFFCWLGENVAVFVQRIKFAVQSGPFIQ